MFWIIVWTTCRGYVPPTAHGRNYGNDVTVVASLFRAHFVSAKWTVYRPYIWINPDALATRTTCQVHCRNNWDVRFHGRRGKSKCYCVTAKNTELILSIISTSYGMVFNFGRCTADIE